MSYVQAIVLGLVQGLGEFLPISSSAHLVLVPWFMGWTHFSLTYDVALHMGTLLAVTIYFWRDLISLATEGLTKGTSTPTGRLAWGIAAGTVPGALFGYFLEERVDTVRNPISIAILLALMGIVLYVVDRRGAKNRSVNRITLWDVVIIGVGQAFAIIPGVSRSGATISVALMRGLERGAAAKVSFLLGWPIILGAGLLALRKLTLADLTPAFWTGIAVSGLSGYLVIAFLMDYLRRGTFLVFAIYRVAVAALTVFIAMLRG